MILRLVDGALHLLHLGVIAFCSLGWIWPAARPWHLGLCGLVLLSWFLLGRLLNDLGFCLITGVQQALWRRQGRRDQPTYMVYLYESLLGQPAPQRLIAGLTQGVLYGATCLSAGLLLAGGT